MEIGNGLPKVPFLPLKAHTKDLLPSRDSRRFSCGIFSFSVPLFSLIVESGFFFPPFPERIKILVLSASPFFSLGSPCPFFFFLGPRQIRRFFSLLATAYPPPRSRPFFPLDSFSPFFLRTPTSLFGHNGGLAQNSPSP